jgi:hypothetical protein
MKLEYWGFGLVAIIIFLMFAFQLRAEEPLSILFKTIVAFIGLASGSIQLLNWKSDLWRWLFRWDRAFQNT